MRKPLVIGTLATIMALTGCVQPNQQPSVQKDTAEAGQYFQMRDPLSNFVALQMSLPHPNGCQLILDKAIASAEAKTGDNAKAMRQVSSMMSCSTDSAAAELPYRARVQNAMMGYEMQIDTLTQQLCERYMAGMMKSTSAKKSTIVLSECQRKPG